jgi:hypothetical protein
MSGKIKKQIREWEAIEAAYLRYLQYPGFSHIELEFGVDKKSPRDAMLFFGGYMAAIGDRDQQEFDKTMAEAAAIIGI